MGSVVISDVVSDTTRFPFSNMLAGNVHQHQRSPVETSYRRPTSTSSQHQPAQQQHHVSHPVAGNTQQSSAASSTSATTKEHRRSTSSLHSARFTPTQQYLPPYTPASATTATTPPSSYPESMTRDSFAPHQHPLPSRTPTNPHLEQTPPEDPTTVYVPASVPSQGSSHVSTPIIVSPPDVSTRVISAISSGAARTIKIHSLSHIQQLARDDVIQTRAAPRRSRRSVGNVGTKFEISDMPVTDVIEMVAGLLTKITTTNDRQHEHLHRNIPSHDGTAGLSQQTSSVLAFHGKNVPSITILSYLSRIHKYCPTTYEVFLSLLVYFDRMTERVNSAPGYPADDPATLPEGVHSRTTSSESISSERSVRRKSGHGFSAAQAMPSVTPPPSSSSSSSAGHDGFDMSSNPSIVPESLPGADPLDMSHFFVVDSFNIHRLVIAGVTCASKFFSDVFYTNSRYAKVGGLPLVELNHLEIQFLLLNDFRLSVPVEELEAYGTMLVEFYAREAMSQPSSAEPMEGVVSTSGPEIVSPP